MSDRSGQPYLRDQSERLTDETDAFGHRDYATALTHALTEAEPPFTVGLFGAWGTGKSTILGEVRNRTQQAGGTYIYFDAWRYEGEAFRREFLRDVANKLGRAQALKKSFDVDEELRDFYTTRATPDDHVTVSKAHALRATIVWMVVLSVLYLGGLLSVGALTETADTSDPAILAFLGLLPLLIFLLNRTTDVIQVKQTIITEQRLEEPERFTERFGALLRAVTAKRVVIAIDNLDRLSADDAVALLSTVKTYLEPVIEVDKPSPAGDVVFLIAADDAALREHLMTRAPRILNTGRDDTEDRQKAERYADEYLRKFFNTSIPLHPVLDDDIRGYMRGHLAGLAKRWEREDRLDDLVRLCAAGLRHNPRRVKQFVNNLELRLQLIRARESSSASHVSKIDPPISEQLAVVAKLALIEEEWPEQFEDIRRHPRRLHDWEEHAWRKEQPEEWRAGDWQEFAAFLRASRHIDTPNLRPFIRLKRSVIEAALPRYDEFHEAVTVRGGIENFPLPEGSALDRYADRLADVAEEELKAGNLDAAVVVIDNAVSVEQFAARKTARGRALSLAVREPDLRAALTQVSPTPLVAGVRELDEATRTAVHEVLVDEFLSQQPLEKETTELGEALASVADQFAPRVVSRFSTGLDKGEGAGAFGHYASVVEARPELLPPGAAKRALDALSKARVDDRPQLRKAGPAWRVVQVAIRAEVLEDEESGLVDHIVQVLNQSVGQEAVEHVADLGSVVPRMKHVSADAWQRLAACLSQHLQAMPAEARRPVTDLAVELLERVSPDQRPQLASQLGQQMFSDSQFGVEYVQEHADDLPDDLRELVAGQLEQHVQRGQLPAAKALLAMDPARGAERIAAAAVQAAAQGQHGVVTGLYDHHRAELKDRSAEIAEPALVRLQQSRPMAADLELVARLSSGLNDNQRERLVALVRGYIQQPQQQGQPGVRDAVDELVRRLADDPAFDPHFKSILAQILGSLGQSSVATVKPTVTFLSEHFDKLERAEREQFLERLRHWLRHERQEAVFLASIAKALPSLRGKEADDLARALIEAELAQDATDVDTRVALVTAVVAVANASQGKRVGDQRDGLLKRLREGEEHERGVYERFMDPERYAA